jgi:proline iminopeptidase
VYPEIEPYDHGLLDVGDGNLVYWEVCGNPDGKPAVVLHGGPGSGCVPWHRRFFDPSVYRIVLLDQRNCGRSIPHASEPDVDLSANSTDNLVADLERLRELLGIGKWLVFGGSWGSILGLTYAERYPARVSELVLTGVFTGSHAEHELLTRGLGGLFPEAWQRFRAAVPDENLLDGYHRLLFDPDPAVREKASRDWCDWEEAIAPAPEPSERFMDVDYRLAFTRIVTHYWRHDGWLGDGVVLREVGSLAGIPGVIVQGVLDVGNLLGIPWELKHAWPGCELVLVGQAGHHVSDAGMSESLIAATDRFGKR